MSRLYFSFISIPFISFLGLGCTSYSNEARHQTSFPIETLSKDGVWCWFSDPRAIYYSGKNEKIYFGYVNGQGDVCIGSKDLYSGKLTSFILQDTLEIDDHNVPSILVLPDGKLLSFYNEHNGSVFMRKSKYAEDISSWEEVQVVSPKTETYRYTYTNPIRLSAENGRIYLIGRKVGPTRSFEHWWQYLKYSDDEGQSWSKEIILLDNQGRKNPPYLKVSSDHKSRIDFAFTDGHPKIGSDVSLYHMYYSRDTFFQTNGLPIRHRDHLPIRILSVDKVYDASRSQVRSWIWDIAFQSDGPVITYVRYPTESDHIYHYTYWTGSEWIDQAIVNSGSWMPSLQQGDRVREAHYSGGIVLDHQDPSSIYLSRSIYGKYEIEHRQLEANGQWNSTFITEGSAENNVRPFVVDGVPRGQVALLWLRGTYRHYTDYHMSILMKKWQAY